MMYRQILAREFRQITKRSGVYQAIEALGMPHRNGVLCIEYGNEFAERVSLLAYQVTRAAILGYSSCVTFERLRKSMHRAFATSKKTKSASTDITQFLGDFREARKLCRQVEKEVFSAYWKRKREGEYLFEDWIAEISFFREVDIYTTSTEPSVRFGKVFLTAEEFLQVDMDRFLGFGDMAVFEDRYRQVVSILDSICRSLPMSL
jgi:hypothetical protein